MLANPDHNRDFPFPVDALPCLVAHCVRGEVHGTGVPCGNLDPVLSPPGSALR